MAKSGRWSERAARIALSLAARGLNDGEIAQQLGISPISISRWKNRYPLFKAKLAEVRAPLRGLKRVLVAMHVPIKSARGQQLLAEFLSVTAPPQPKPITRQKLSTRDKAMAEKLLNDASAWLEQAHKDLENPKPLQTLF